MRWRSPERGQKGGALVGAVGMLSTRACASLAALNFNGEVPRSAQRTNVHAGALRVLLTPLRCAAAMSPPPATAAKLSPLALLGLTYAYIASGPYGIEPAVAAGGALLSIAGLVAFALLWALPQALLAAELTAAMPESGSVVVWLERGVGRRWAAVGAGCLVLSQIFDLAIFTGQVIGYASQLYPALGAGTAAAIATQVALCVAVAAANLSGLGVVTGVLVSSLLVTVTPFVLAPFAAAARGVAFDTRAILARPQLSAPSLSSLCSLLLWTYVS